MTNLSTKLIKNLGGAEILSEGSTTARSLEERFADVVSVKDFGAVGDGVSDDTAAIEASAEHAYNENMPLYFPSGTYIMTSPLVLGTNTFGEGTSCTRIDFVQGFVNPEPDNGMQKRYLAVYNKNYDYKFNESTADTFDVSGIHFHMSQVDSDTRTAAIFGTSNTKGCRFFDLKITADWSSFGSSSGARTCMSFYDGNRDMDVFRNILENNTEKAAGGCIWLQGGSGASVDEEGSENIRIFENILSQSRPDTGDEAIGCYGASGLLRNVDVYNNTLILDGGGQGITVFNTANSSSTASRIEDIKIRENTIYGNLTYNGIRVGGENLPEFIKGIQVRNNRVNIQSTNESSSYGIRCTFTGDDVIVDGNMISNIGSGQISRGIEGDTSLQNRLICTNNNLVGDFYYGIRYSTVCRSNYITGSNFAVDTCKDVRNNNIFEAKTYGVRSSSTFDIIISDNKIEMASGHSFPIYASSGSSGDFTVRGNDIVSSESVRCLQLQNTGFNTVTDNRFTGTGLEPNVSGSIGKAENNYYFNVFDDFADSAGAGLAGLRLSLPIGHFIRNSNPSVVSDRILLGWVLDDTRVWKTVYIDVI